MTCPQRVMVTANSDGKIIRAVLQADTGFERGWTCWEDIRELPITEDGKIVLSRQPSHDGRIILLSQQPQEEE